MTKDQDRIAETMIDQVTYRGFERLGGTKIVKGVKANHEVFINIKTSGCGLGGIENINRWVMVTYNAGPDTYTVTGLDIGGKYSKMKEVYKLEGVYSDMLPDVVVTAAEASSPAA